MADARLIIVRNPFNRAERDERVIDLAALPTLAEVAGHLVPCGDVDVAVAVAVNGEVITANEWSARTLRPGDQVVVAPVVAGGDDGLGMILSIAVMAFAPYVAGLIAPGVMAAGGIGAALLQGAVGLVGSLLVGALVGPSKPTLPARSQQSYDASPAYAWQPFTTQEPGGPVVRAYGRIKLYGNIIAGYIENTGDTGRQQVAHLLLDLGLGPYSAINDIKLNDQPIGYFSGVSVETRLGALNQDTLPAFNDTMITRTIGAKVVKGSPVTRDTVGNDYDALEIVVTAPNGLWYSNDSGGLSGVSVYLAVEVSADGGATWRHVATTPRSVASVSPGYWSLGYWGEAASFEGYIGPVPWYEYQKGSSVRADHTDGEVGSTWFTWRWMDVPTTVYTSVDDSITLTAATQQPVRRTLRADRLTRGVRYKVRVTNLSDDQTSNRYGDDVYLAEINEVLYDDFQYPRTVLAAVRALATEQISSSIKFSCVADAALVRVWDGSSWSVEFSRNTAWVCFDILTQPVFDNDHNVVRYDAYAPSRLILAEFYAWAQFCDALVPDGAGGSEPRCCWDGVFDTQGSVWDAALEVAATARAVLVPRGTRIGVVVDTLRAGPAQLFSVGNTSVNGFREAWLPMADRACAVEIEYVDRANDYVRDKLTVVNGDVTEAAAQRVQKALRGVIRGSQAWREAMVQLKRNELIRRSGELSVDIDALACQIGDLIWLQSDLTRWGEGGRLVSGTTTSVVLDHAVTLDSGKIYELKLRLVDDTLLSRTITTAAGTVTTLNFATALPSAPSPFDPYAVGEVGRAVKEFIVTDIVRDGDQRAKLSLVEYNATLYTIDDGLPALPTPDISGVADVANCSNIRVEEAMYLARDGSIAVHAAVWFDIDRAGVFGQARVTMARPDGTQEQQLVRGAPARFDGLISGETYQFTVATIDLLGTPQPPANWASTSYSVRGELPEPSDVASLSVNVIGDTAFLEFPQVEDFDLDHYRVRFSKAIDGSASWQSSIDLIDRVPKAATTLALPAMIGTWLIKAYDRGGRESKNAAIATSTVAALTGLNFVATAAESPGFTGTHSGTEVVGGALRLSSNDTMSAWTSLSAVKSLAYGQNGIRSAGTYTFAHAVDLGAVYTSRLTADVTVAGTNLFNFVSSWVTLSGVTAMSGTNGAAYRAGLEVRTTNDDPGGTPVWSAWKPFVVGDYTARAFQFRLQMQSSDKAVTPEVSALSAHVDMPDRTAGVEGLACPAGGATFTFSPAFKVTPAIGISARGLGSGDYYVLGSASASGFHLQFFNGAAGVARTFDYVAKGYGRLN